MADDGPMEPRAGDFRLNYADLDDSVPPNTYQRFKTRSGGKALLDLEAGRADVSFAQDYSVESCSSRIAGELDACALPLQDPVELTARRMLVDRPEIDQAGGGATTPLASGEGGASPSKAASGAGGSGSDDPPGRATSSYAATRGGITPSDQAVLLPRGSLLAGVVQEQNATLRFAQCMRFEGEAAKAGVSMRSFAGYSGDLYSPSDPAVCLHAESTLGVPLQSVTSAGGFGQGFLSAPIRLVRMMLGELEIVLSYTSVATGDDATDLPADVLEAKKKREVDALGRISPSLPMAYKWLDRLPLDVPILSLRIPKYDIGISEPKPLLNTLDDYIIYIKQSFQKTLPAAGMAAQALFGSTATYRLQSRLRSRDVSIGVVAQNAMAGSLEAVSGITSAAGRVTGTLGKGIGKVLLDDELL